MNDISYWRDVVIWTMHNRQRRVCERVGYIPAYTDAWLDRTAQKAMEAGKHGRDAAMDVLERAVKAFEKKLKTTKPVKYDA